MSDHNSSAPFQTIPSSGAIARYFVEQTARRNPGCDGINLYRNDGDYCYLWVEATVDHDMSEAFLLDIRTCIDDPADLFNETRDYLFVRVGGGDLFDVEWHDQRIRFDAPSEAHHQRGRQGLRWFLDRLEASQDAEAARYETVAPTPTVSPVEADSDDDGEETTLTPEQDAALDRLAEQIVEHVKAPCDEPEPCLFHRTLRATPV